MSERRSTKSRMRQALIALCLGATPWPAIATVNEVTLHVETLNDDLRAGGAAWFVMRMKNGSEQLIPLTRQGEHWPGNSRRQFSVAPRAPADWGEVRDVGIRFRPDRGRGLRKADDWQMSFSLAGARACFDTSRYPWTPLAEDRIPSGTICPSARDSYRFEGDVGEQTRWARVRLAAGKCRNDLQCDRDGRFCNALDFVCRPREPGADVLGCVKAPKPVAACPGQPCDEASRRCLCAFEEDADGDGVKSIACGGTDCDDANRNRFPGNPEICDAAGVDEDCNPNTFGNRDQDGDGFVDARCWNDPSQRGVHGVPLGRRLKR